jgi:hypothetical protein
VGSVPILCDEGALGGRQKNGLIAKTTMSSGPRLALTAEKCGATTPLVSSMRLSQRGARALSQPRRNERQNK